LPRWRQHRQLHRHRRAESVPQAAAAGRPAFRHVLHGPAGGGQSRAGRRRQQRSVHPQSSGVRTRHAGALRCDHGLDPAGRGSHPSGPHRGRARRDPLRHLRARDRASQGETPDLHIQGLKTAAHSSDPLLALRDALRRFAAERDWGQFHSPKNLAVAVSVEAAELLEHFQWLTDEQSAALSPETRAGVSEELADVLLYLIRLADRLDLDLIACATEKLRRNADKYPVEKARGNAKKYTQL